MSRAMSVRTIILTPVALLLTLGLASSAGAQYKSDPPRRSFLFKDARGELAAARARKDTAVTLVVAAMPGANPRAVRLVAALGGTSGSERTTSITCACDCRSTVSSALSGTRWSIAPTFRSAG